jgi:hypothetical protein
MALVTRQQVIDIYRQYTGRDPYEDEIAWHTQSHPIEYNDLLNWAQTAPEVQAEYQRNQTTTQPTTTPTTRGQTTGQGRYLAWMQTDDGRILSFSGANQQQAIDEARRNGWVMLSGQSATPQYTNDGIFMGWREVYPDRPSPISDEEFTTRLTQQGTTGASTQITLQDLINTNLRTDLQELYYVGDKDVGTERWGRAKDPNDSRVAGIPTISDWWTQYGQSEYPGVQIVATKPRDLTEDEKKRLEDSLAYIDATDLPDDQKLLLKTLIQQYPPGVEVTPEEILSTFEDIKTRIVDPHYKELTDLAIAEITQEKVAKEASRNIELELERIKAAEDIRQAQLGLEKSGLTFTGESIRQLGGEYGAYAGITGIEGMVPTASRLTASATQARYDALMKALGLEAEKKLGTTALGQFNIPYYTPVTGITGEIETKKQEAYGQYLRDILANYYSRGLSGYNVV